MSKGSLLELSLSIEKSLSCVIEQLVIWHYILVELSLEVQGGQNYFRFVEGTCIIACVLSFFVLLLIIRCTKTLNSLWLWTTSDSEPMNNSSERKKEKFLKTQFNPPSCGFSHLHYLLFSFLTKIKYSHLRSGAFSSSSMG